MEMKQKKDKGTRYRIPAVQRTFAILELFARDHRSYTLSDVSRLLKLPVSTTSALLYTIQSCGYLSRGAAGRFALTTKLLAEGSKAFHRTPLREAAGEVLKYLTGQTGLTSVLAIQEGHHLVWIDKIEGTREIRLVAQIGKRMYPHQTSSGKAILAYLPEKEVAEIVKSSGLPRATSQTIRSIARLKHELSTVRSQGYATDDEESAVGIRGIGAPIFDEEGKVVASIAVAGTIFDFDHTTKSIIAKVRAAAMKVSERLGYSRAKHRVPRSVVASHKLPF